MHVYFDENYWGCLEEKAGEEPGRKIQTETAFVWEGRQWQIPAVYLCEEGLVMDLCGKVTSGELADLREKWGRQRSRELTGEEEQRLCLENPFHMNFWMEADVNGAGMQRRMGCGSSYCPPESALREEEAVWAALDAVEEQMIEAYGLDRTAGWVFWRNSFAWPEGKPDRVHTIDLTIRKEPVDLPGPHFWTGPEENGKEVELIHPVTGKVHRLTVLRQELAVLPVQDFPSELEMECFPDHFTVLHYQVEPKLPGEELLISDCAQPDQPVRRTGHPAASSMSVIGGADGPTSVFFLGKTAEEKADPARRSASSALHYEPVESVEWRVTFRVDEGRKIRVSIQNLEK